MKLSEAIEKLQDDRYQEIQRLKREREHEDRLREQRELEARDVFLAWFNSVTGIDDLGDGVRMYVEEYNDGMHVWWAFANGGQVRFNGQFSVTDGEINLHPYTDTGEIWHAVVDRFYTDYKDYKDFVGAAIYALNLPREKPRDNALLAVGD